MSDDLSAAERGRLAGWDPADGEPPFTHSAPPSDDPALGNNGISEEEARRA